MGERIFEARLRTAAAEAIGDDVARDRVEERKERTARLVPRHCDERALEDFAGHVLGLRSGAHTEERVAVNGTDMQVVELGERSPVSGHRAARQVLFIDRSIGDRQRIVEVFRGCLWHQNVGILEVLGARLVPKSSRVP